MTAPRYPSLYQINTRVWLTELARALGRPATLDDVPDAELDRLAARGFDWVWMLSVWKTGVAGRAVSRANPEWRKEFEHTLPDLREEDIAGSGFAITGYTVSEALGGDAALARLRARLADRGMRLMLDFVPNHTGLDHPWVDEHPDYYVSGTEDDLAQAPANYTRLPRAGGALILAHGRDPYFPGWPDTLQLDYGNPATQEAMIGELERVAGQCDGVRCDMAMLVLPDVFERTWGRRAQAVLAGGHPARPGAGPRVLLHGRGLLGPRVDPPAAGVRLHVRQAAVRQAPGGPRAARARAPPRRDRLPGTARAVPREPRRAPGRRHLQPRDAPGGRRHHVPRAGPALLPPGAVRGAHGADLAASGPRTGGARRPVLSAFYDRLLAVIRRPALRVGDWRLLPCGVAWDGNATNDNYVAYSWQLGREVRLIVAVNASAVYSQCFVRLPFGDLAGRQWRLEDLLGDAVYVRDGSDLQTWGLFLDEPPWKAQVFLLSAVE